MVTRFVCSRCLSLLCALPPPVATIGLCRCSSLPPPPHTPSRVNVLSIRPWSLDHCLFKKWTQGLADQWSVAKRGTFEPFLSAAAGWDGQAAAAPPSVPLSLPLTITCLLFQMLPDLQQVLFLFVCLFSICTCSPKGPVWNIPWIQWRNIKIHLLYTNTFA